MWATIIAIAVIWIAINYLQYRIIRIENKLKQCPYCNGSKDRPE